MSLETRHQARLSRKALSKATHWEWNKIGVELWTDKVTTTEEKERGMKFVADFLIGIGASIDRDLTERAEFSRSHELGHALRHKPGKYTDGRGAFRLRVTLPTNSAYNFVPEFECAYAINEERVLKGEGPQAVINILEGPKKDGLELSKSDKKQILLIKRRFNLD